MAPRPPKAGSRRRCFGPKLTLILPTSSATVMPTSRYCRASCMNPNSATTTPPDHLSPCQQITSPWHGYAFLYTTDRVSGWPAVVPSGSTDCESFVLALFEIRKVPYHNGRSPAQILYNHRLLTCMPAHPEPLKQELLSKSEECDHRVAQRAQGTISRYNKHAAPCLPCRYLSKVRI